MSEYQYYEFAAIDRLLTRDLERFLITHTGRRALLQRLTTAGLWQQK